jgi:hypothetical protein
MDKDLICIAGTQQHYVRIDYTEDELRMLARYGGQASTTPSSIVGYSHNSAPTSGWGPSWPFGRKTSESIAAALYRTNVGSMCTVGDGPERFTTGRLAGDVHSALAVAIQVKNLGRDQHIQSAPVPGCSCPACHAEILLQYQGRRDASQAIAGDVYVERACKMFGVLPSCVTAEQRREAKRAALLEMYTGVTLYGE